MVFLHDNSHQFPFDVIKDRNDQLKLFFDVFGHIRNILNWPDYGVSPSSTVKFLKSKGRVVKFYFMKKKNYDGRYSTWHVPMCMTKITSLKHIVLDSTIYF